MFFTAVESQWMNRWSNQGHVTPNAFPSTGILDNFNRADVGPPPSANWTTILGTGYKIVSNQLVPSAVSYQEQYWNASTWADVEAYVTLATVSNVAADYVALKVRGSGATMDTAYEVVVSPLGGGVYDVQLNRNVAGVGTVLGHLPSVSFSNGDGLGISAIGTTISVYKRTSGVWSTLISVTDSVITAAGNVDIWSKNNVWVFDDFGGGKAISSTFVSQDARATGGVWSTVTGGFAANSGATANTTRTITTGAVSVGDLIVVQINRDIGGSPSRNTLSTDTVTDSLGNTYTYISSAADLTDFQGSGWFYSVVTTAGTPTLTAHFNSPSAAPFNSVGVQVYRCSSGTPTLDTGTGAPVVANTTFGTSGANNLSVGPVTPTHANALVVGSWSININSGGTDVGNVIDTASLSLPDQLFEHKELATPAATSMKAGSTATTGSHYVGIALSFIPTTSTVSSQVQNVRVTGQASSSQAQNVRAQGQATSSSATNTRATGKATSISSQNARATGQLTSSLATNARTTGQATSSSATNARATGTATSFQVQNSRATGTATSNTSRNARATGQATSSQSQNARATGTAVSSNAQNVRAIGTASSSSSQNVRATGTATTLSTQNVRATGTAVSSSSQNVRLIGVSGSSQSQPVRATGTATSSQSQPARATGQLTTAQAQIVRVYADDTRKKFKAFGFNSTTDGFSFTAGGAGVTSGQTGADGSLAVGALSQRSTAVSATRNNFWEWTGTYEDLGVPAGAVITDINAPSYDYKVPEFTSGSASTTGALELRDGSGTLRAAMVPGTASFSGTTGWLTRTGIRISGLTDASNTSIRLRLNSSLVTSSGSPAISLYHDNVQFEIWYSIPATSTSSQVVRVTGQALSSASQAARATGSATSASTQNVRVTGQSSSSSSQNTRTTGQALSSSSTSARATGQATSSQQVNVRATGQATSSTSVNARLFGSTIQNSNVAYNVRTTGTLGTSVFRNARVTGQSTSSLSQNVRATGQNVSNNVINVRASGQAVTSSVLSARTTGYSVSSVSNGVRATGQAASAASVAARLTGQAATSSRQDVRTFGQGVSSAQQTVRAFGEGRTSVSRDVRLSGQAQLAKSVDTRLTGQASTQTALGARVTGQSASSTRTDVRLSGQAPSSTQQLVRAQGQSTSNRSVPARVVGFTANEVTIDARLVGQAFSNTTRNIRLIAKATLSNSLSVRASGLGGVSTSLGVRLIGGNEADLSLGVRVTGWNGSRVSDGRNSVTVITRQNTELIHNGINYIGIVEERNNVIEDD